MEVAEESVEEGGLGTRKLAQGTFEWQLGEERKEGREFVLRWWLL